MKYVYCVSFLLCLYVIPAVSSAYTVTDTRTQKINETTAIYFIDYSFGHEDYALSLPVLAKRGQEFGSELNSIGFEILAESEDTTAMGTTQAIVLSKAPIRNGMYETPKGFKLPFTLAVILTTPENAIETDYAVQVTDLPFYMGERKDRNRLNASELKYYITDEVELNESNTLPRGVESIDIRVHSSDE